jgi:uncharacterized membrane protein YbhN (UPF0104 family)
MRAWFRKWWPVGKAILAVAILVAVGRQFARDLQRPELWQRSFRPEWLALAGVLYLLGIALSAFYWQRLLRELGQRPTLATVVRAYYLGHLGKYLPGKAWALFLRTTLSTGPGVRIGVAVLTSFYEVLATMAAGVLLAAVLFALLLPPGSAALNWATLRSQLTWESAEKFARDREVLVALALLLLIPTGGPILPPVFNRIVYRLSVLKNIASRQPGGEINPASLPRVRFGSLFEGLVLAAGGWLLLGASLWAVLAGILREPPTWQWDVWCRYSAMTALAYVAGFVIVVVPGGLGVREFFLTLFLTAELTAQGTTDAGEARALAVLAVLLLRLVWTAAELTFGALVYWLPGPTPPKIDGDSKPAGRAPWAPSPRESP